MAQPSTLVWFRHDLRVTDNPALDAAIERGSPVVPVFIWAPEEEGDWPPGAASRWWLHQSLCALDARLRQLGARLILRRGPTLEGLTALLKESGADAAFWNRRYEPAILARDAAVLDALRGRGYHTESFNAALLHEPWTVQNQSGKPFRVFTPFWKQCLRRTELPAPLRRPGKVPLPPRWPRSLPLEALELAPKINWAGGISATWQPGELAALSSLKTFLSRALDDYSTQRNRPDVAGTSRLSPHLHFGEIGPRQIWHGLRQMAVKSGWSDSRWRHSQFLAELGWREFAHHLLYHFPKTPTEPLRPEFKKLRWRADAAAVKAWQKGRTGYPIVDAGMRELWKTGWMHNRVRMVVASFLVKDLLTPWQEGARWFWDTLVDADLAQNTLGWQWTAGCGADAAPFFRIFNPTIQGDKFDPEGDYVRRWCPELAELPPRWIHRPDKAPPEVLRLAGIQLGTTYPRPIISHGIARDVALEAFARLRKYRG